MVVLVGYRVTFGQWQHSTNPRLAFSQINIIHHASHARDDTVLLTNRARTSKLFLARGPLEEHQRGEVYLAFGSATGNSAMKVLMDPSIGQPTS